jgi:predicted metal-dependent hydrolase
MQILSLVSDLFFSVQIESAVKGLGWTLTNVERADQIHGDAANQTIISFVVELQPSLIIAELSQKSGFSEKPDFSTLPWEKWIAAIKTSPATRRIPVIGFGSHVDLEQRERALGAGCDEVYAKGRFTSDMVNIIQKNARVHDPESARAAAQGELSKKARHGIELFNRGEYFESHEELEHAWNDEPGAGKELYRAILQIAVAYLQIQRRNYNGAIKMFLRARQWIDPLPDVCRGVDIAGLRSDAADARATLEALGAEGIDRFDLTSLKPIVISHQ